MRARRWWVDETEGSEPDYRFTLANERTFLAWIRTSLGLVAGGVAVSQLIDTELDAGRTALAVLAIATSVVLAVGGYRRWVDVQRAVRSGDRLPPVRLVPLLTVCTCALAVVAVLLVLAA